MLCVLSFSIMLSDMKCSEECTLERRVDKITQSWGGLALCQSRKEEEEAERGTSKHDNNIRIVFELYAAKLIHMFDVRLLFVVLVKYVKITRTFGWKIS